LKKEIKMHMRARHSSPGKATKSDEVEGEGGGEGGGEGEGEEKDDISA